MTADPLTDLLATYGIAGTAYAGLPAAIRREVLAPIRAAVEDWDRGEFGVTVINQIRKALDGTA